MKLAASRAWNLRRSPIFAAVCLTICAAQGVRAWGLRNWPVRFVMFSSGMSISPGCGNGARLGPRTGHLATEVLAARTDNGLRRIVFADVRLYTDVVGAKVTQWQQRSGRAFTTRSDITYGILFATSYTNPSSLDVSDSEKVVLRTWLSDELSNRGVDPGNVAAFRAGKDHVSRPLWSGYANNALLGAAGLGVLWAWPAFGMMLGWLVTPRRIRRARRGLCPTCTYDRRGLDTFAPCPECGARLDVLMGDRAGDPGAR